jgi:hypothetical protein
MIMVLKYRCFPSLSFKIQFQIAMVLRFSKNCFFQAPMITPKNEVLSAGEHNIFHNYFQLHLVLLFPHFTTLEKPTGLHWRLLPFRLNFFLVGFLVGCNIAFRSKTLASIISKTFSVSFIVSISCNSKVLALTTVGEKFISWLACLCGRSQ